MRFTRTVRGALVGLDRRGVGQVRQPVRAATPAGTTPATPSDVSTPAKTRSNSRAFERGREDARRRDRVGAGDAPGRSRGRRASRPSPAPCASSRVRFSGAIVRRMTSPSPAASISLSAFSSTYSSLPLTTAGLLARSSRPSGPRRSPPEAGSGTGFVRTTMRTSGLEPPGRRAVSRPCRARTGR